MEDADPGSWNPVERLKRMDEYGLWAQVIYPNVGGFGNQLFGRALGFGTYKLKYGHRGINQPVMDRTTGKVEVTAHNHGFAVDAPLDGSTTTDFGEVSVSHVGLHDDVQPPVGKAVDHLHDRAADADVAHALVVLEHEPELVPEVEALADQLVIARLEDVQRCLLAWDGHGVEGEEPEPVPRGQG